MARIFYLLLFYSIIANATEKHALIIAVGEYPKYSGWNTISATNDARLIQNELVKHGFPKEQITVLENQFATNENIKTALRAFEANLRPGDVAFVHFSGHGQPIWDINGDEIDGYDEAWVPYDAGKYFVKNTYEGENHLRDDEIGAFFLRIRKRLGLDGQLLVLMDSCHSGTASRGVIGDVHRGSFVPFQPDGFNPIADLKIDKLIFNQVGNPSQIAPWVVISASKAGQLNYEFQGTGSLTYAFCKVMSELPNDFTYRALFGEIQAIMLEIVPSQQPTLEGSGLDLKVFKNEYVEQKEYFEIADFIDSRKVKINAGLINNIANGTIFKICKIGEKKPTVDNVYAEGRVVETNFNSSILELSVPLTKVSIKKYWLFPEKIRGQNFGLKIFYDYQDTENKINSDFETFLKEENIGTLVDNPKNADLGITKSQNSDCYLFFEKGSVTPIMSTLPPCIEATELQDRVLTYARGKYLMNLHLKDSDYSFKIKLLPIKFDSIQKSFEGLKEQNLESYHGMFKAVPKKDFAILQIQNLGTTPFYFTILEINSCGEIVSFLPNSDYPLTDEERRLVPNQTKTFKNRIFGFKPPYETLVLKGFATNTPINFHPKAFSRSGVNNALSLDDFFDLAPYFSRGDIQSERNELEGFSDEFIYKVVEADEK